MQQQRCSAASVTGLSQGGQEVGFEVEGRGGGMVGEHEDGRVASVVGL